MFPASVQRGGVQWQGATGQSQVGPPQSHIINPILLNPVRVWQCDSETNQESQTADSPAGDWQSNITPSGLGGLLFSQSELEESIRIVAGLSFTFTSATGSVSHPVISPGEPAALEWQTGVQRHNILISVSHCHTVTPDSGFPVNGYWLGINLSANSCKQLGLFYCSIKPDCCSVRHKWSVNCWRT